MKSKRSDTAVTQEAGHHRQAMLNPPSRGSVLFIILLAVALFAALSYAITQSSRSGGANGISPEKARLAASEIVQYAGQVEQAIMRLRITNRCLDTQISFENPYVSGYANATAPSDKRCHVFEAQGGGVPYKPVPPDWLDDTFSGRVFYGEWFFSRTFALQGVGSDTPPPTGNDLPLMLLYLKREVCSALQEPTGVPITNVGAFYGSGSKFTGAYYNSWYLINLSGRSSGCVYGLESGVPTSLHAYLHVLIPR